MMGGRGHGVMMGGRERDKEDGSDTGRDKRGEVMEEKRKVRWREKWVMREKEKKHYRGEGIEELNNRDDKGS